MKRMGKEEKDYPALWALAKLGNYGQAEQNISKDLLRILREGSSVRTEIPLPLKHSGPAKY